MAQGHGDKPLQTSKLPQWRAILSDIPPNVRFFGLVIVVVEIILGLLVPLANDQTRTYIALGIIAIGILCVIFVGISLLQTKPKPDTITLPAPPQGKDGNEVTQYKFDVFVAAPIDALLSDDERSQQRDAINAVIDCIKKRCKFQNIYFAGEQAVDQKHYDQPSVGLLRNVQRIRASTYFMLIYPKQLPTSALVEVGMALALGKRSVWFVQKNATLPYLLREGGAVGGRADLPRINTRNYEKLEDVPKIIDDDPEQLFNFD